MDSAPMCWKMRWDGDSKVCAVDFVQWTVNHKLIPLLAALALSLISTGCQTENVEESHASAVNLRGDHQAETSKMGDGNIGSKNGMSFRHFSVGKSSLLLIFYTNSLPDHTYSGEAGTHQVYAWLIRHQPTDIPAWQNMEREISLRSPQNLSVSNSEPLHGHIKLTDTGWRQKNLFHITFALEGDDGASVNGEFKSYDRSKFDPNMIWLVPYMLICGPFVDW